ncbi:hypothetical protein [Streptomyces sp. TBY4]|uniref:hypothetical protein n=1 Tax=Streptomyces sp. TBY4 TaxID=2962030 RepID=UPI0020B788B5|nr:hypothetical protein [Streptomyces sp. TBY4]MCP3754330.1 hypothetical protein [Streptomyces sp. TBY4]
MHALGRLLALACAVGAAMTATACAGPSEPAATARTDVTVAPQRATPPVPDPVTLSLPLDAYRPSKAELAQIDKALDLVTDQCMRRYGFQYTPAPPLPAYGPASDTDLRYGIHDAGLAAARGYRPAGDEAASSAAREAADRTQAAMSEAERTVLVGPGGGGPRPTAAPTATVAGRQVPERGCFGEATARVTGGASPVSDFVQDLGHTGYAKAQEDPQVVAAFGAWSRCMKEKGFGYAKPMDAPNDPRFSSPQPAPAETATATADVECRTRTNVIGVWYATEVAFQKALIERNAPSLTAAKQAKEEAVRHAAEVLAAS